MPARPPRRSKHASQSFRGMTMAGQRAYLNAVAAFADEYAGLPSTLQDTELVIHPSYKWAEALRKKEKPAKDPVKLRNCWRSAARGFEVGILENPDGTIEGGPLEGGRNPASMQLHTLGLAGVWDIAAEEKAMEKLRAMIKPHLFDMYRLTGAFLETSPRSKVTYIFRRLRPTLALSGAGDSVRVLCALCLHPIGYYKGTWGGCMVPTDDVIAHLALMRGDEPCFWKQANQIAAWRPESGL